MRMRLLEALGEVERYPDLLVADLRLACGECGIAVVHKMRDELGIALPAVLVSGDIGPAAERDARRRRIDAAPEARSPGGSAGDRDGAYHADLKSRAQSP